MVTRKTSEVRRLAYRCFPETQASNRRPPLPAGRSGSLGDAARWARAPPLRARARPRKAETASAEAVSSELLELPGPEAIGELRQDCANSTDLPASGSPQQLYEGISFIHPHFVKIAEFVEISTSDRSFSDV